MSIIDAMREEFVHEAGQTRKLLERVPEGRLGWQPHPKSMTLRRLAGHIAEIPMFAGPILTTDELDFAKGAYTPFNPENVQELLAGHQQHVEAAAKVMCDIPDAALMKVWRLRVGEKVYFELPRVAVLRGLMMSHILHHRGQLTVYLRLNNVPLPMIYGPSADETRA